jgi:hypothetical protein
MRSCRHCAHENADHLPYCSRCGRRFAGTTFAPDGGYASARGQMAAMSPSAVMSRTMLATPPPGRNVANGPNGHKGANGHTGPQTLAMGPAALAREGRPTGGLRGAGDSISYIYVFLRGKIHAGERRRRLVEESDGATTLLAGAIRDLGTTVLREGVQHADLTGLLEAFGRAEASREGAIADLAAAEHQKAIEETRLAAQEAAFEAEWKVADGVSTDADEVLRAATVESERVRARLGRVKDERARLARDLEAAAAAPDGQSRVDHLKHDDEGAAAEQRTLEAQIARLEPQLADLRAKSAALRAAAGATRSKLDQALVSRRQVASAMAASVAGHVRDRANAEQESAMLTEQLGRATLQARPAVSSLLSVYQRVDRLQETIADRTNELGALERASAAYDGRKLSKGIGLVTFLLAAGAVALWFATQR